MRRVEWSPPSSCSATGDRLSRWIVQLRERVGWQKAAVALANKHARILWSMLVHGQSFDPEHVASKHLQMRPPAVLPAAG